MKTALDYLEQPEFGFTGPRKIAYRHIPHKTRPYLHSGAQKPVPGVLFCGGFHSNMDGGKAEFLHEKCSQAGLSFTRFDYGGHGHSGGAFADGTIGDWYCDAKLIFDQICQGPQIVVGSSMGGWMAMMLARDRAARIGGLVLVAPAPDFPQKLMLPMLPAVAKVDLQENGVWYRPSEFEDTPYPITQHLIEESKAHEVLDGPAITVNGPVTILHGTADEVIPLTHARTVANWIDGKPVTLNVIEGGDHRLSTAPDLYRLWQHVQAAIQGS